jgi:2-C-methyl-D-erythritol 4-phosphate cytidylyltransferase
MIEGPAYGIVVAAGRSERMGGVDKVFAPLAGRPLLAWTLRAFKNCPVIDGVVVVVARNTVDRAAAIVREWRFANVVDIVAGGDQRQDSVRAGLEAARDAAIVAVHDGGRPLVTTELIERGVGLARETGAAVCAVPSRDTVKQASGDPPVVQATVDRSSAWLTQTPQCFDRALLLRAHKESQVVATDDAALVEALGHPVRLYPGDFWNLKVTTQEDLTIAEALIHARFAR